MKSVEIKVGNVFHDDRERIVRWLRCAIGGDVARTIADAIERGDDITYDRESQIQQILLSVDKLAHKDCEYLHMAPTLPRIYDSGVRYDASLDGTLYDIPTILADPSDYAASIESLVAWRCAELWQQGVWVSPYVKWYDRENGGRIYTLVVRLPDGTEEDVVRNMRMC